MGALGIKTRVNGRLAPMELRVVNLTRGSVVCERLETADSAIARMRGLIGRSCLDENSGLLFFSPPVLPVMWMHTFGMHVALDIVFLDRGFTVLKIDHSLAPGRLSSLVLGARAVIEIGAGEAHRTHTSVGDTLRYFVRSQ